MNKKILFFMNTAYVNALKMLMGLASVNFTVQDMPGDKKMNGEIAYTFVQPGAVAKIYTNPEHPYFNTGDESLDVQHYAGVLFHEMLHKKYTDPRYEKQARRKPEKGKEIRKVNLFHDINNILEDFVIEARGNILVKPLDEEQTKIYRKYYKVDFKSLDASTCVNLLRLHMWARMDPLEGKPGPDHMAAMLMYAFGPLVAGSKMDDKMKKELRKILKHMISAATEEPEDRINRSISIYKIIEKYFPDDPKNPGTGTGTAGENSTDELDPGEADEIRKSRKMKALRKMAKASKSSKSGSESGTESGEDKDGSSGKSDKESSDKEDKSGSSGSKESESEEGKGEAKSEEGDTGSETGDGKPEADKSSSAGASEKEESSASDDKEKPESEKGEDKPESSADKDKSDSKADESDSDSPDAAEGSSPDDDEDSSSADDAESKSGDAESDEDSSDAGDSDDEDDADSDDGMDDSSSDEDGDSSSTADAESGSEDAESDEGSSDTEDSETDKSDSSSEEEDETDSDADSDDKDDAESTLDAEETEDGADDPFTDPEFVESRIREIKAEAEKVKVNIDDLLKEAESVEKHDSEKAASHSDSSTTTMERPELPAYKGASIPLKNIYVEGSSEETLLKYNAIVEKNKKYISRLANRLANIIDADEELDTAKTGRLSLGRYVRYQGTTLELFEKRTERSKDEAKILIMLDISGSMAWGGKIERAKEALICVVEALARTGIPVKVICFTEDSGRAVVHYHYVNYKGGKNARAALANIRAAGDNFDGFSIRCGVKDLMQGGTRNTLMMVISDGQPASGFSMCNKSDAKAAVAEAKRKTRVIGIGIDSDKELQKEFYQDTFVELDNLENLTNTLGKIIVKEAKKWN